MDFMDFEHANSFHAGFFRRVFKNSPFDQPVQQERFLHQGLVPKLVGHSMVQAWRDGMKDNNMNYVTGLTHTHRILFLPLF